MNHTSVISLGLRVGGRLCWTAGFRGWWIENGYFRLVRWGLTGLGNPGDKSGLPVGRGYLLAVVTCRLWWVGYDLSL